jgi:ornithine carbamoyltransferase
MSDTPNFLGRNVFDLDDYSAEEILYILEAAKGMKEINLREYKKSPLCAEKPSALSSWKTAPAPA